MEMPFLLNPIFTVFVSAMAPIGELRGSIPLGLEVYRLDPWTTFFVSVLGNMIPVFFILWLIDPVSEFLRKRFGFMDRFFSWLFERTRKHGARFDRWGPFALLFFVAIPLPMTGAWTGALAAFLFGIKMRHAIPILLLGVMVAGIIVTFMTLGIESLLR